MKNLASSPMVRFWAMVALALGELSCLSQAGAQEEWKQFAFSDQSRPGEEIVAGPNIWVEAVFIEMGKADIRNVELFAGLKLSPPDGKAILSGEEKERLLGAIERAAGARTVATLALLTITGRQSQTEIVYGVTYQTEDKCEEGSVEPATLEAMDLGAILNVTATILEDGRIALVMLPEVTTVIGWERIAETELMLPVRRTWNRVTTVIIADGSTLVLKESLANPFLDFGSIDWEAPAEENLRRAVEKQLDSIIPQVKFENAKLTDVVDFLSRATDTNFVVHPVVFTAGRSPFPRAADMIPAFPGAVSPAPREQLAPPAGISVDLKNVPLKEALREVLGQRNLTYFVGRGRVHIVPAGYVRPKPLEREAQRHLLMLISAKIIHAE